VATIGSGLRVALKLYHLEDCPFCEKVRLSLKRMALEFEGVLVRPNDRAEVERISGQKLVPVLYDEEGVMPDSTRILRYLVARYGERGLLPPEPADQAIAWIVEDYSDEVLGPLIDTLMRGREGLDLPTRKDLEKQLETQFRNLEQLFSRRSWVVGESASLADICIHAFLNVLTRGGREISAGFPHLRAWSARMDSL